MNFADGKIRSNRSAGDAELHDAVISSGAQGAAPGEGSHFQLKVDLRLNPGHFLCLTNEDAPGDPGIFLNTAAAAAGFGGRPCQSEADQESAL